MTDASIQSGQSMTALGQKQAVKWHV